LQRAFQPLSRFYRKRGCRGGIECPSDISVIGFDDIDVSQNFAPPLTTMHQPREEIGRLATGALIDIIEGVRGDDRPLHVVLTSRLVVRASTAPLRG
jgi:LacI family repressor for deo operon, udp, cdd, tsx, nupC, and nupG